MTTPLTITRDLNGTPTSGSETSLVFSTTGQYFTLTANTVTNVTVPTLSSISMSMSLSSESICKYVVYMNYSYSKNVWVQLGASPVLTFPNGTVSSTTAELNPSAREVRPGDVIQFLTSDSDVSVSLKYYVIA